MRLSRASVWVAARALPSKPEERASIGDGCMVLTYLEIYYPAPQDASGTVLRAPVTLHLDRVSEDLQISRRTLFTALCVLAARWGSEEARGRAARAGREFLNPAHTRNGHWKFYSVTGAIGMSQVQSSSCAETSRSSLPCCKRPESHRSRSRCPSAQTISRLWTTPPSLRKQQPYKSPGPRPATSDAA